MNRHVEKLIEYGAAAAVGALAAWLLFSWWLG
jgi:hypothetical protein